MKDMFLKIKTLFAGKWSGYGFARFPTINDTDYTEELDFSTDNYKDVLFFQQKAWYKNNTSKNGHTVFWDTGFIILKEDKILLHSVQVGGRIERLELIESTDQSFTFNSSSILNDPLSIRSQRVFTVNEDDLHYELNMATHSAVFQNHLKADLKKIKINENTNTNPESTNAYWPIRPGSYCR
jgi:hypothetical protein